MKHDKPVTRKDVCVECRLDMRSSVQLPSVSGGNSSNKPICEIAHHTIRHVMQSLTEIQALNSCDLFQATLIERISLTEHDVCAEKSRIKVE